MLFGEEFPIALEGSEARHDTCGLRSVANGVYFVDKIVCLVAIVQHEGRAVLLEEIAHEVRLTFLALAIGRCGGIEALCLHHLAQLAAFLHKVEKLAVVILRLVDLDPLQGLPDVFYLLLYVGHKDNFSEVG